ncbi:hypothetical protein EHS25_001286 [Saitozyma podzolica]|uniref:RNase III domain-containing protein n=1 Tax=Saitozyma podzolica TaxID=1890683 RepID=A0A427YHX8_9TREE|nr:hypothetical protein EHS25_001286 [Saitozyma podzolica]
MGDAGSSLTPRAQTLPPLPPPSTGVGLASLPSKPTSSSSRFSRPNTPWRAPSASPTINAMWMSPSDRSNGPSVASWEASDSPTQIAPAVNQLFIQPTGVPRDSIKVERKTPTRSLPPAPPTPVSALQTRPLSVRSARPKNTPKLSMPPLPVPNRPTPRKRKEHDSSDSDSDSLPPGSEGEGNDDIQSDRDSCIRPANLLRIKREPSSAPSIASTTSALPIPILPTPLPSKRFKKNPTSRAVLVPVEQLPTVPLPPLPTIEDPELLKHVFTHSSLFEKVRGRFEDPVDQPAKHYEKLEHVGDSILGMVVTTWLHETKPRLTCGTATKLKAHLVSNATLSHISGLYNLPQRLDGDPNLLPVLRAQTDVRAALVEAYIAALYFSFPADQRMTVALPVIDGWLREMYEPFYDFFYQYMKNEYTQHHLAVSAGLDGSVVLLTDDEMARIDSKSIGMSNLLVMYTSKHERELRWETERYETNVGVLWKVGCCVDGIELGDATRASKKTAKNVAAWEAAKKLGLTVGSK